MHENESRYTLDEYWKLVEAFPDHKYEYVDGYIRKMSRGTVAHSEISMNIGATLHAALRESECHIYSSNVIAQLTEKHCYCPDVTVSCDPQAWRSKDALDAPGVVVEVLYAFTEKIDKLEKLPAYQKCPTIQEILLVESRKRYVEHYKRTGSHRWDVAFYEDVGDSIELSSIKVKLSMKDIYLKVHLE
ncbi:Uma2 family endonuclease [Ktedonosporobacter rubrisoli]|uniref:Uma2 family endonuclease n=1 Tax=Ktedonosporobacter rubrisoli TaxID=2509675 RepID=A0A4P6JYD5_KTERU|nr:Uma2 family endonuclease [Ktedonosporobacter rubrisoli]QBD80492.1 Uma2 family endonuclease [Ktedonosporobacter rubrisoli]